MKRQLEVRPVVLSYLLTVGALLWFGLTAANAADSGRTVLAGHVPPEVSRLVPKSRLAGDHVLALAIGLPLRNQDALNQLIGQLYDPASTNYHRFLSNQEFTARFGPTAQDYETVKQFVRANGLRVAKTYPNRLILDVQGDAAHIEQAFQTTLRTYRHPSEPRNFFAPDTEPSVPVGVPVNDMFGLSDFSRPRPMVHAAAERGSGPLNYNGSGSSGAYQGRDFRNAYIPGSNLNGSGQVVALFELDGYYTNDISAYEANCGYTNVPLQNVYVGITNGTPPGYSGVANAVAEVSLDIEMVVSMAPGLANVLVYEGNNPYDVYNQIVTDNAAKQISSSWFFGVGPSHRWHGGGTTLDSLFQTMIAQGQALFQASGDSDAWTGSQAFSLTSGPIPMDSPYLTCVGGTSLTMNGSGASWSSETVWNYASFGGADANVGSGGGVSTYYGIPAWQTNVSMAANSGSTVNRNLPDVALTADYIAVVHDNGTSDIEAGTSCAAPLWAGFCALANQFDAATNGTTLGFVNPALYAIGGSSAAARSLHDITTGSNIGTHTAGLYNAVPGYDLATGFGTPAGTNLITALAWPPPQFTAQPVGRTVTNGVSVTLAAAASSSTPEVYFWQCNGTNLAAGSNISGVGTNTLAISAATTNNSGNYQLVVSNFTGFATSRVAVLNVGFPPSVSVSPSSLTLLAGSNAVFTATAGGTAPFGYRWHKNGTNFAGAGITGTNGSVLTLAGLTTNSTAGYAVVVTNSFGSITSSVASLAVVLPPSITASSLTNRTLQCGSNSVAFAVTVAGTTPLFYQWSLDGVPVINATNSTCSLTNVHLPNHTVSVQITNLYAAAGSNAALVVQDTLAPVITLNGANPLILELGGAFTDPGATAVDLCSGPVAVTATGVVNTNLVGTNTVIYQAGDGNGNTNTAIRTVIVRDTTPPVISWSFTNLVLAADTNCGVPTPDVTGTNYVIATDLSGVLLISQFPTNETILSAGTNTIVITVKDASGNAAYSTNTIFVQDRTPPVISLNGANPLPVEFGQAFVDPGAVANDACEGPVPVAVSGAVNTNALGTNTVTYTASDSVGNTNTVSRTVIVRDSRPPAILWSFTNLMFTADSNCAAVMPDVTGTNFIAAADLSPPLAMAQSPTNGSALPVGTNVVIIAVADAWGNTAYSTNQIVVRDVTPPVIVLNGPDPLNTELGAAFADPGATASDACSGLANFSTNGLVNTSVVGTNTVTYVAVDGSGNTNAISRTVYVIDTTAPTISWSFTSLVLAADSNCVAVMPDVTGTNDLIATDLSGLGIVTQSQTNGATLPLGTNEVILAVPDTYGNTAYSTNWVVVRDLTPPLIVLNGNNVMSIELGSAFVDPGASAQDDCSGLAVWTTNGAVNTTVVGTNTVTYVAVDGSGNTNTATRTVYVRDTTAPAISWSFTNLVLAADSNCVAVTPDVTGTNAIIAADLSGLGVISQAPTNGAVLPLGTNEVIIAVPDTYGNTAYSTNWMVVRDEAPPIIVLNGSSVIAVELGNTFTDPGAVASDACSGLASFTTNGVVNTTVVGTNTLAYIAVDGSGNTNIATRTVYVRDTTAPAISWSFTNLVLAADSNCVAVMPDVTGTNFIVASDLSKPLAITQAPTNTAWLPLGTNSVMITVADAWGNKAYSTNLIVVRDVAPPEIVLNGSNVVAVELGATFTDPGASASDACSGVASFTTNGVVNTTVVGTNTLAYIAVDGSGNTNIATRTVYVRDTTPPTVSWSFTNLTLAANSNCAAVMPDVTGTNYILAADLSQPLTITQSPTNNDTLPLGTNVVLITAADAWGNTVYSTNIIVVADRTPPLILSQPQSRTNDPGSTVQFSVAATACTPLSFQWLFNQNPIAVQTNDLLTLSNLNLYAAGPYQVVIASAGGSVTSTVAVLTIYVPPTITAISAPQNGAVALTLAGSPNTKYVLQAATNLGVPINWIFVATNILDTNGLWQFTDTQVTNHPQQFYRLMLAP